MTLLKLKHIADFRADALRSPRPMIALEHLQGWTGTTLEEAELGRADEEQAGVAAVEPGDVLFGKLRPYLAKTFTVDRPMAASTELICMRPTAATDGRWLGYVSRSTGFIDWSVATSEGTKMPRTSWEKLREFPLRRPSLEEQRAIADYLDTETARIDALITKKQQQVEALSGRWNALRNDRILSGLNPVTGDGAVQSSWRYPLLGILVELQRGHDLPSGDRRPGPVPVVSSGGVSGWHDEVAAPGPGVVTGRYGTIGEVFFVEEDYWPLNTTLYVSDFRGRDPRWTAFVLESMPLDAESDKSAVGGINRNVIGRLRAPLPPLDEQRRIAAELAQARNDIDEAKGAVDLQVGLLRERRRALVTAAVTGEFRVPGVV